MDTNIIRRDSYLKAIMLERNIDLIIATTPENIRYLTGYSSISHQILRGTQVYAAMARDGRVVFVAGRADLPSAVEAGLRPSQFYAYGNFQFRFLENATHLSELEDCIARSDATWLDALKRACTSFEIPLNTIAVDEDGINLDRWDDIETAVRPAKVIRGARILKDARGIKLSAEVNCLQRAAQIAEEGVREVCGSYREGMTEIELAKIYESYVVSQGAQPFFTVISSGERSAYADTPVTDRIIRSGDIIRFDIGCIYKGYRSDIARTAVVGTPSEKVNKYYDAIYKGLMAAVAAVRPGVTAESIFDIAVQTVREAGMPHYQRHHAGHAIGLEVYENPIVAPNSTQLLEEGMVLCLETPYYELGWGGVQVEDTLLVTKDGCKLFTESPVKPFVLGAFQHA
jgi:Xaa-Pro dipeptidase